MQRVEQPIMTTGLERIAAKAREERKLKFTSLAHHVTEELIWESVCHVPTNSAPGCDEQTVTEAKETFKQWAPEMLRAIHQQGDRAGTATQCGRCPGSDLRTRLSALFVWWPAGTQRSSRAGNADGSHRGK